MCVAAQIEAEMAKIARPVLGLGLGAQNDFVQNFLVLGADRLGQDAVELPWTIEARLRGVDVDAGQKFAQRDEFLGGRRVVHPVDQGRFLGFEGFRRGDIRLDHEFFDEPVRVEALRHDHLRDKPTLVEYDLAFGKIEVEGPRRSRASLRAV